MNNEGRVIRLISNIFEDRFMTTTNDGTSSSAAGDIVPFLHRSIDIIGKALGAQSLPLVGALGSKLEGLAGTIKAQLGSYLTPTQLKLAEAGDLNLDLQGTITLDDLPLALGLGGKSLALSLNGNADAQFGYRLTLRGGRDDDGTFFLDTKSSKLSTAVDLDVGALETQGRFGPVAVSAVNQASTSKADPSWLGKRTSAHADIDLVPVAAGGKLTAQTIDDVLSGKTSLSDLISATGSGSGLLSFGLRTAIEAPKDGNTSFKSVPPNFTTDFVAPLQVSFAKNSDQGSSFVTVDPLSFNFENIKLDLGTVLTGLAAPAIATADRILTPFYSVSAFFQKPLITPAAPAIDKKEIWTKPFEAIQRVIAADVAKNIVDNLMKMYDTNADGTVNILESIRGSALLSKKVLDSFDKLYNAASQLPTWSALKPGFDQTKNSLDVYKTTIDTLISALDAADLFFVKLQKFQTFSQAFASIQAQNATYEFRLGDARITSATSSASINVLTESLPGSNANLAQNASSSPVTGYAEIDQLLSSLYDLGFSLPAITDPQNMIGLFFSQEADLLTFEDQLNLKPGPLQLPINLFQIIDLVVPGFSKIVSLLPIETQLQLYAIFSLQANLSFGIDTRGVINAAASGNPASLFDGFYFSTLHDGVNLPELTADLTVGAKGKVEAGIPAFGASLLSDVGIQTKALLDLVTQDASGKLRGNELFSKLGNPLQLFNAQVNANFFADTSAEAHVNLSKLIDLPASIKTWIDSIPGASALFKAVDTVANFLPAWSGEVGFQWTYPLLKWDSTSFNVMAATGPATGWAYIDGRIEDERPALILPPDAGSSYLRIVGENDRGEVFGNYQTKEGLFRGFATGLSLPSELNGLSFFIEDFNDHDQFVASILNADGSWTPILGDQYGITRLSVPGAQELRVHDINNDGIIILEGVFKDDVIRSFAGKPDALKEISMQGSMQNVHARAINEAGDIVGFTIAEDSQASGLLISQNKVILFDFPGAVNTVFNSINNKGQIVGEYVDPATGAMESFLMSGGNFFKLLPDNSEATSVSQISDNGTICFALNKDGQVRDLTLSQFNAFLPVEKSDSADVIYLLYEAVLNRRPDASGFAAWTDAVNQMGLRAIANDFVVSAEFKARTVSETNIDFINTLYVHALGREPEANAVDAWGMFLEQGSSRADLALAIVRSPEMAQVTNIAAMHDYSLLI